MLCRQLGKTPAELEAELTSEEFGEFMADYAAAPWGEMRADLQAGIVAATIANVNRKSDARAFAPSDFMPRFGEQAEAEPELSPQEFFAKVGA